MCLLSWPKILNRFQYFTVSLAGYNAAGCTFAKCPSYFSYFNDLFLAITIYCKIFIVNKPFLLEFKPTGNSPQCWLLALQKSSTKRPYFLVTNASCLFSRVFYYCWDVWDKGRYSLFHAWVGPNWKKKKESKYPDHNSRKPSAENWLLLTSLAFSHVNNFLMQVMDGGGQ